MDTTGSLPIQYEYNCPCGKSIVSGFGARAYSIFILSDKPDWEQTASGSISKSRIGALLKQELAVAGISPMDYYVDNLWKHERPKNKSSGNPECVPFMVDYAVQQMSKAKYVLLCGSEVAETFLHVGISTCAGLEVHPFDLPNEPVYYAMVSPTWGYSQTIGEVRLTIQKFARRIKNDTR